VTYFNRKLMQHIHGPEQRKLSINLFLLYRGYPFHITDVKNISRIYNES